MLVFLEDWGGRRGAHRLYQAEEDQERDWRGTSSEDKEEGGRGAATLEMVRDITVWGILQARITCYFNLDVLFWQFAGLCRSSFVFNHSSICWILALGSIWLNWKLCLCFPVALRWEEEKYEYGVKWKVLEHKGPWFPPEYQPLPKDVRFYYDGREPVQVSPAALLQVSPVGL